MNKTQISCILNEMKKIPALKISRVRRVDLLC